MARTPVSEELKKAISRLPSKEKDKYLFRLIAKDPILLEQLEFQLLDERSTVEERRENLQKKLEKAIKHVASGRGRIRALISEVRSQSAGITRHLRVTGDKYGEIELNLILIREALAGVTGHYLRSNPRDQIKLYEYLITRLFKLSNLIEKIHMDYRLDFAEKLQEIGGLIGSNDLMMHTCIMNGMDVNVLLQGDFPIRITE
ncbi:MAG: hypothetical protein KDC59_10265 [Saprospiraceae bacterium]|nr:hypothetical protein [Saprospiraceae bacterium]